MSSLSLPLLFSILIRPSGPIPRSAAQFVCIYEAHRTACRDRTMRLRMLRMRMLRERLRKLLAMPRLLLCLLPRARAAKILCLQVCLLMYAVCLLADQVD